MLFEPKLFYNTYLDDYHKFKVTLYSKILEDISKYEINMFGEELSKEHRDAFRRTIKSELRQTYFHSIETFFEILFALISTDKPSFDDVNILFNLTNSNWKVNYEKIIKIASGDLSLEFLENDITYNGRTISVGHYLFYFGLFDKKGGQIEFYDKVKESIKAIKYGIKILANDFIDREEYNSYKHGLRIIPVASELMLADPETMEVKIRWNLENSMSFYSKTKDPNELKIKTKLFDTKRDSSMATFCSNLISNLIFFRKLVMYREQTLKETPHLVIPFFSMEKIDEANRINVEIQDLVYSIRRSRE